MNGEISGKNKLKENKREKRNEGKTGKISEKKINAENKERK